MHRNAAAACDEADDIVARHRIAAMSQTDQQAAVVLALDDNAVIGALCRALRFLRLSREGLKATTSAIASALVSCSPGLGSKICPTLLPTARGQTFAGADGGKQVLERLKLNRSATALSARVERGVEMP